MCGFSPVSLATHLASLIPGASQMLLGAFSSLSAFFHMDASNSAGIVVIPDFSTRTDKEIVDEDCPEKVGPEREAPNLEVALASSGTHSSPDSNKIDRALNTFLMCFFLCSTVITNHRLLSISKV
jgi:hypothetical protein